MDLGCLGVIGMEGEQTGEKPAMGTLADELGILPARKKLVNDLNEDTIP